MLKAVTGRIEAKKVTLSSKAVRLLTSFDVLLADILHLRIFTYNIMTFVVRSTSLCFLFYEPMIMMIEMLTTQILCNEYKRHVGSRFETVTSSY